MIDIENNFYDRKSIIGLIRRRVIDLKEGYRQNLALLGSRFLGKSSILRHFLSNLDDDEIVAVYLDLENADLDTLYYKFAGSLLFNFSQIKSLPLHEDIDLLLESSKKLLPQTVQEIKKLRTCINAGRRSEAYLGLISLPEVFTAESGKFCIIILDEFHNLDELMIPHVFKELGKKIMTQKKCLYIVTSSLNNMAQKILSEKLSLLFGNFEIVEVKSFDLKTSQKFIEHNLGGIKINVYLKNFLIDFTAGHPFYLNIICREIIRLSIIHNQQEVFLPLLVQTIENVIFSRWGILRQHFDTILHQLCSPRGNRIISAILISLANGKHKLKEIVEKDGLKKTLVSQKMNILHEMGIIAKNGNYYHFQDKLLRFWVKYIYQRRLKSINSNPAEQKEQFKKEIKSLASNFQMVSKKDLFVRIVDLLHCFDNEAFHLKGRRYKLPSFHEIVPLKLDNIAGCSLDVIKAHSDEGTWFIILKEETLLEKEVNDFLKESKKLQERPQRRVIISLSDLDVNVRLRALQEKMWIWNEDELNTLLNLYDKPYIVK